MSFLRTVRGHFGDDIWAENILSFADAHGCLPSEYPHSRYAFDHTFGRLHSRHPLVMEVELYGHRNAMADLEEELLNIRPHVYTRYPLFHRIRRIPRLQRFSTIMDASTIAMGAPVQVVDQQQLIVQPGQPAAIMAPPTGVPQVADSQMQQGSQMQGSQMQGTQVQQSSSSVYGPHSTKAPAGMASQFVSQFPVSSRQQPSSSTNRAQPTIVQPTVVKPTVKGSSSHRSTATTVKPTVRGSSSHSSTATTVKPTTKYSSSVRPGQSQYKTSSGQSQYKTTSGQSQSSKSHLGFSMLATAVNDDRFPPEHIPLDGLSKIPNPKYPKPDHNNPDHWYYCTIVRNNTAKGMGTKRAEAQEKGKKKMIEKGLNDDKAKRAAVNQAIESHKTLQFISDGSRGQLYLLKPGFEHIMGAAISMGAQDGKRWTLLGIGEKSIKDHYLMLALKM